VPTFRVAGIFRIEIYLIAKLSTNLKLKSQMYQSCQVTNTYLQWD